MKICWNVNNTITQDLSLKNHARGWVTAGRSSKNPKKARSYISKVESGERGLDIIEYLSYFNGLGLDPIKWLKKLSEWF